jgi:DNA-binding transcriptional MerR regulator
MGTYSTDDVAERAGVQPAEVARLSDLGVLDGAADAYDDADVRRVQVVQALERAGLPVEGVARLLHEGRFSLRFLDEAGAGVFSPLSDTTFAELSLRSGIPLEVLTVLRDVTGGASAGPDDRVREDELEALSLVALQLELGFRPQAVERALRVCSVSTGTASDGSPRPRRSGGGPRCKIPCSRGEATRTRSAVAPARSPRACRTRRNGRCSRSTTRNRCRCGPATS